MAKLGKDRKAKMGMLEGVHRIVWGPWLMVLFLAAGMRYTVQGRGFQLRGFRKWWKATAGDLLRKRSGAEGTSRKEQLRTACTALAATVGTGNIVGVATAITCGGPGALFWMWVSAFVGMATAYGEVYLGTASRFQGKKGEAICGPFVYLERMAGQPGLALFYAGLCVLCSLGMGSMVQANSLAETARYSFHIPAGWMAILLCALVVWIIRGGGKGIQEASAALVPFSAGLYLFCAVAVIFLGRASLGEVLKDIFQDAFQLRAAAGGGAGYGVSQALRYGLARGVFSNEAGLGSLAVLHGDSPGQDPALQGMWAIFEVFFDTIVVCTLTGLAILCSIKEYEVDLGLSGAALASWCFSKYFGSLGGKLVSASLIMFAFATIIAWYYLGSQALRYLLLRARWTKHGFPLARLYQWAYLLAVGTGCVLSMGKVWLFSDILNGLLALPNLAALFLLAREVKFPEAP